MGTSSISVNVSNFGQVFGCIGLLEIADALFGEAEGAFDLRKTPRSSFLLRTNGSSDPVADVVQFIQSTTPQWYSPFAYLTEAEKGQTETRANVSARRDPQAKGLEGALVGEFAGRRFVIPIGFWADGSTRFSTTFQKPSNGISAHVQVMAALDAIRPIEFSKLEISPLDFSTETKSLFRLDPRGNVESIHAGFSPNSLKDVACLHVAAFPLCELLAVIGLEHARPKAPTRDQLEYCVWGGLPSASEQSPTFLRPELARAAVGGALPFVTQRCFIVEHRKEGSNPAAPRIITNTFEKSLP